MRLHSVQARRRRANATAAKPTPGERAHAQPLTGSHSPPALGPSYRCATFLSDCRYHQCRASEDIWRGQPGRAEWIWFAEREDEAMTPFKRHLGRRLAGVGVGAALVLIGLETPAFAVSPTITSFSPTSGPTGCVVVIRGTNFKNPIVTSVDIGGTPVSEFKVVSGKEIWATVAGDASGPIHVTNASDIASGPTEFANANPGDCSPTITYFTPCSGVPGLVVTIIGTNLLKSSGTTTTAPVGGDVRFAPTQPRRHIPGHRRVRGNSPCSCRRIPSTDRSG